MFSFVILKFPIIHSYNFIIITKLPTTFQAWVSEIVIQVAEESVLDSLPTRTAESSTLLSPQDRPPACFSPGHQKESVHLSQEGQRSIFRP